LVFGFVFVVVGFLAVLGFELRALHLLGSWSTTLAITSALFALVVLEIGSHVFAQANLDCNPPILCFLW
jgi:hypothetical protein